MKITSRYTARNDVVIPGTGVGDTEPSQTVDTADARPSFGDGGIG